MKHILSRLWYRLFICPKHGHFTVPIMEDDGCTIKKHICLFCGKKHKVIKVKNKPQGVKL